MTKKGWEKKEKSIGARAADRGQAVVNNDQFKAMMDSVQRLEAQQQAPQGAHYPGVQRPEGGAL